jgi:hypothetical protein
MVSNAPGPDLSAPERMFIPTPPEGELPPEAWRQQAGQFANDLAFEPGLLARKDAYWVYVWQMDARRCASTWTGTA